MEVSDVKKYVKWKYNLANPTEIDHKTRELFRRIIRPVHLDQFPNAIGLLLLDTAIENGIGTIAKVAAEVDINAVNMCSQLMRCLIERAKIEKKSIDEGILRYINKYVRGGKYEKI